MKSRDQTFQPALNPTLAQHTFEEDRVKMALTAFGLGDKKWELLDAHDQEFGSRRLTFAGFRRRFPTFPVVLDARHVGGLGEEVERRDLFRRPDRVFMTDLYLEAYAKFAGEAGGRPIGLVLPFGGLRGGVVLHDGHFRGGSDWYTYGLADGPPHRVVEPFARLLSYLAGGGWSPGSKVSVALPVAQPRPPLAAAVRPWMVRRLGTGPAIVVLGWLYAVLTSDSPADRVWVRRDHGGERYLHALQEEVASETGLTRDQVKRALVGSRGRGWSPRTGATARLHSWSFHRRRREAGPPSWPRSQFRRVVRGAEGGSSRHLRRRGTGAAPARSGAARSARPSRPLGGWQRVRPAARTCRRTASGRSATTAWPEFSSSSSTSTSVKSRRHASHMPSICTSSPAASSGSAVFCPRHAGCRTSLRSPLPASRSTSAPRTAAR